MREGSVIFYFWAACFVLVQAALALYGLHRYTILALFLKYRKRAPQPAATFDQLPHVTVQLPIFNEMYVVERLISAVGKLDYPREKLEIQVLDDSTDETSEIAEAQVKKLRALGFDAKFLHRDHRVGYKAGALDAGLKQARGEFIFILDADFVTPPDILKKTIHFFTDPKIGMVQTRWGHLNKNYSLLTRVQSMFIDAHFVLEQVARSRSGRFFNFNGTGGIWRRRAIEQSGGWQHDTLTEDLDLSYRAQLNGWRFVYIDDVVTPAELPIDMNGFKSQQHRWAKGSVQTCVKILPAIWRSKLPFLVKLEATAHLSSYFICLFLALYCLLMFPTIGYAHAGWVQILCFDAPVFIVSSLPALTFYLFAQHRLFPKSWWKEILMMPALVAVGAGVSLNNARAVLEALFKHQSSFTRTPKYGIEKNKSLVKKPRYAPLKSLLTIAELAFSIYFALLIVDAYFQEQYGAILFLALFQIGFTYVAVGSIARSLPRIRFEARHDEAQDALPA